MRSSPARRDVERMIRSLRERPSTPRGQVDLGRVQPLPRQRTLCGRGRAVCRGQSHRRATHRQMKRRHLAAASYSGWTWTTENFRRMVSTPDTARTLFNTLVYVSLTLVLFNTGFAMVLALAAHYMPERPAGFFRILWLLPRITPPVIYVLMWKWLPWDTGFSRAPCSTISACRRATGCSTPPPMPGSSSCSSTGFVGASMGMLIFSSAIKAISAIARSTPAKSTAPIAGSRSGTSSCRSLAGRSCSSPATRRCLC